MPALPDYLIPALLIVLHGLTIPLLINGRRAILMGNWFRHRNFMLASGGLFAAVMLLSVWQIAVHLTGAYADMSGAVMAVWAALALYALLLALLTVLVPWTLYRVARHLLLPHKLMARWTIRVWFAAAASGIAAMLLMILSPLAG